MVQATGPQDGLYFNALSNSFKSCYRKAGEDSQKLTLHVAVSPAFSSSFSPLIYECNMWYGEMHHVRKVAKEQRKGRHPVMERIVVRFQTLL